MANQRRRRAHTLRPSGSDSTSTRPDTVLQPITEGAIRAYAYELYRHRGGQHGHDWDDWFRAERELRDKWNRSK